MTSEFDGAVVFDFDGVLGNTEPLHLRATQQVLTDAGVELSRDEYYERYLGYDDAGMFRQIATDRGLAWNDGEVRALMARKAALMPLLLQQPDVLFPSAAGCVRELGSRFPLAIASGALRREIELVLEAAGLRELFRVIVAAGDTPAGKPAPDPYARAVTLLAEAGVVPAPEPARVVAIEDSVWGLESARAAGLRCVAVTTSYPADALRIADLVVDDLAAVDAALIASLIAPP